MAQPKPKPAPFSPVGLGPVSAKRQEHEDAFASKWQGIQQNLIDQAATPRWTAAAKAVMANDRARLMQGRGPLTGPQTDAQIIAAHKMRPTTRAPQRDTSGVHIAGNLVSDIQDMGIGVGKMIAAPFSDISSISQATRLWNEADARRMDPKRHLNWAQEAQQGFSDAITETPIIRNLPFAHEIADTILHPLGMGLDPQHDAERKAMVAEGIRNGVDRKTAIIAANEKYGTRQTGVSGVINNAVDVLNSPGVRMIPGVMPLANVLSQGDQRPGGGFGEIAQHPGFNIASLLPLGKGLAARTEQGALEAALAKEAGLPARPMSAYLKNTVETADDGSRVLVPRPSTVSMGHAIRGSNVGSKVLEIFGGGGARSAISEGYGYAETLDNIFSRRPTVEKPSRFSLRSGASQMGRSGERNRFIDPALKDEPIYPHLQRAEQFTYDIQSGRYGHEVNMDNVKELYNAATLETPAQILARPKGQQDAIAEARIISDGVTHVEIQEGILKELMIGGKAEYYDLATAAKIEAPAAKARQTFARGNKEALQTLTPKLQSQLLDPRYRDVLTHFANNDIKAARDALHDIARTNYGRGMITPEHVATTNYGHTLYNDWRSRLSLVNRQIPKVEELIDSTEKLRKILPVSQRNALYERLYVSSPTARNPNAPGLYDQLAALQQRQQAGLDEFAALHADKLEKMAVTADAADDNFRQFAYGVKMRDPRIATEAAHSAVHSVDSRAPWTENYARVRPQVSMRQHDRIQRLVDKAYDHQKASEKVILKHSPRRFDPALRQALGEKLWDRHIAGLGPVTVPDAATRDAFIQQIHEGELLNMIDLPVPVPTHNPVTGEAYTIQEMAAATTKEKMKIIQPMADEVKASWQEIRDVTGIDPIFLVNAGEDAINQIGHASMVRIGKTTTEKQRGEFYNPSATVNRIDALITHPAWKMLEQKSQRRYAEYIRQHFVLDRATIERQFAARADRLAARSGNPSSRAAIMDKLISREYVRYDPETWFQFQAHGLPRLNPTEIEYLPKYFSKILDKMGTPEQTTLGALSVLPLNMFRVSVIGLSPRTQLNNITGNVINAAVELPSAARNLRLGWAMASGDATKVTAMFDKLVAKGRLSREFVDTLTADGSAWHQILNEMGSTHVDYAEQMMQSAATLNKWWEQAHHSDSAIVRGVARAGTAINKVTGKPLLNLSDKGMVANSLVDDMTRGSVAISKVLKEFKKNPDSAAAGEAALAALNMARKTTMSWKALTPFERSVMRPIIPFYSWIRHITAFTFNYALDHPMRIAVLGALMDLERSDEETGMPAIMRNMFYTGGDGSGRPNPGATGINIGAMNPFAQMANSWGILGFLSGDTQQAGAAAGGMSPLLKWGMQTLGMDPVTSTGELYPDLNYNPATGMIDGANTNALKNAISSIVPQSALLGPALKAVGAETVGSALATNPDMERLRRSDPQAYRRKIYSTLNMPLLTRGFDPGAEVAKQETRLATSLEDVWKKALESGDMTEAKRWPDLVPRVRRFRKWAKDNPAEFKAMRMPQDSPEATAYQQQLDTLTQLPANGR